MQQAGSLYPNVGASMGAGGPPQFTVPVTKVQLSVSAKKLKNKDVTSKSDPVCVLYWKDIHKNSLHELSRTEKMTDSLNPQWVTKFDVDFRFEERQVLQFHVFDWDNNKQEVSNQDKLGWTEMTLAEVMASGGEPLARTLNDGGGGILVVAGEEVVESKEVVTLNFAATGLDKKDMFGKSDPYLVISKAVGNNHQFMVVYRTQYIKKTLDPVWKPIVIPAGLLCGGDDQRPIKLEVYDWDSDGSHDFIGECYSTLAELKQDKQFPALGFGGRVPPSGQVSHEFFLNGRTDTPYCAGVQGILEAYRHSLNTVGLYGPTNFAPVIRHVAQFARSMQDGKNYFVLLIITDGIITDLPATQEALVAASALPMSVIIVGVGDEDFTAMEQLDGDEKRISFRGQYAVRDIVQFVELQRHLRVMASSLSLGRANLAKDVLAEVPQQVLSWMKANRIQPGTPTPSVPGAPTPSVPGAPTPSVPGAPTPSVPGAPTPSVPGAPTL
ncbi:C2 domain [Trinorchestia longiramus]|nr:C2 domain [Trinorchestia longiramus]